MKTLVLSWLASGKFWLLQNLIAFDQQLNTLFFGGWADETMSSTLWRMEREQKVSGVILRPFVDKLFWFDPDHCRTSYESEVKRNQSPPEERIWNSTTN